MAPLSQGFEGGVAAGGGRLRGGCLGRGSGQEGEAESFGVHPALLDSALMPRRLRCWTVRPPATRTRAPSVRFVCVGWGAAGGGGCLVVAGMCLTGGRGDPSSTRGRRALSLVAVDGESGELAVSVDSLMAREVSPERLQRAGEDTNSLFALDWVTVGVGAEVGTGVDAGALRLDVESLGVALDEGGELPGVVVLDVSPEGPSVERVRACLWWHGRCSVGC